MQNSPINLWFPIFSSTSPWVSFDISMKVSPKSPLLSLPKKCKKKNMEKGSLYPTYNLSPKNPLSILFSMSLQLPSKSLKDISGTIEDHKGILGQGKAWRMYLRHPEASLVNFVEHKAVWEGIRPFASRWGVMVVCARLPDTHPLIQTYLSHPMSKS